MEVSITHATYTHTVQPCVVYSPRFLRGILYYSWGLWQTPIPIRGALIIMIMTWPHLQIGFPWNLMDDPIEWMWFISIAFAAFSEQRKCGRNLIFDFNWPNVAWVAHCNFNSIQHFRHNISTAMLRPTSNLINGNINIEDIPTSTQYPEFFFYRIWFSGLQIYGSVCVTSVSFQIHFCADYLFIHRICSRRAGFNKLISCSHFRCAKMPRTRSLFDIFDGNIGKANSPNESIATEIKTVIRRRHSVRHALDSVLQIPQCSTSQVLVEDDSGLVSKSERQQTTSTFTISSFH